MKTTEFPNLDKRLAQYHMTARGQLSKAPSKFDFAGYAAAVGAGLVLAGNADATIIYSGVQNISTTHYTDAELADYGNADMVSIGQTVSGAGVFGYGDPQPQDPPPPKNPPPPPPHIDLNNDGIADVSLNFGFQASKSQSYMGIAWLQAINGAAFMGSSDPLGGSNLNSFTQIGSGDSFLSTEAGLLKRVYLNTENIVSSKEFGVFSTSVGGGGIVGFKFADSCHIDNLSLSASCTPVTGDYGWIRLSLAGFGQDGILTDPILDPSGIPKQLTVVDWAYEDSGAAIRAGSVPEPSSLALLAAGFMGLAAFRRRKGTGPAT